MNISDFWILSGWIEKYKPSLSKSDSSWDNSYCVRLVIVSLVVNIGKLESLVSEDNCFCWVFHNFCSIFLLYDEKDHSMIETHDLKDSKIIVWLKRIVWKMWFFFETVLSFVLSRKVINIYNDIARKYGNVTVKDFWKCEKLEYKKNQLKLDIDSQQLQTTWCVSEIPYL